MRETIGVLLLFVLPQLVVGCAVAADANRVDVIDALEAEGFAVTTQDDSSTSACIERDGRADQVSISEFESEAERRAAHGVDELGTIDSTLPVVFWAEGRVLVTAGIRPGEDDELEDGLTDALGEPVARVGAQFDDDDPARFATCAELFGSLEQH